MIVTVTPNPSIDRTLRIRALVPGGLVRAHSATAEAAGKGVNVARVLNQQGQDATAVLPLSKESEAVFASLLRGATPIEPVEIRGAVRVNVSLVDDEGVVTKVNEPGPILDAGEVEALLDRVTSVASGATWVVGSGSLPPGAPADLYVRVAVDADGDALRACLGHALALIKPNHQELETLIGRRLPTLGEVQAACDEVIRGGIVAVLVSLGPDGALLVDRSGAWHAEARIDDVINTVGAGDALLAGFLAGGGGPDGLVAAVAWSVAACRSPGTAVRPVRPMDFEAVVVQPEPVSARALAA